MSLTKYRSPFRSFLDDDLEALFPSFRNSSFLTTDWGPKQCAVDLKDNQLQLAFSVQGHEPQNVQVEYSDRSITVSAKTNLEENKDGVLSQYVKNFTQTVKLTDEFDGDNAVAEIKNGILTITVPKVEKFVKKPKALEIKYS